MLLLAVWLGAAIFFGAAVAPALFNVLRNAGLTNANELAGSIVSRLLAILNQGGFEIAFFLLVTGFFVNKTHSTSARAVEMISLTIMAIMTGVSHWFISARMQALRSAMRGAIDQVPLTDARRIAFDSLHRYSVMSMAVAMIAGFISFFVMTRPEQVFVKPAKNRQP
jgi:hypothetical protein